MENRARGPGRPRLGAARHRVPLYGSGDDMKRLRDLTDRWHCSRSEAARRAIRDAAVREGLEAPGNGARPVGEAIIAMFDEMIASVPEKELRALPPDLSENLDHYL